MGDQSILGLIGRPCGDHSCTKQVEVAHGEEAYQAVKVNGHESGSLMDRMTIVETRLTVVETTLPRIEKKLDDLLDQLGKRVGGLFVGLAALIVIIQFFGPSLRKLWGM